MPRAKSPALRTSARQVRGTVALTLAFGLAFQFFFATNFSFDNHPLAFRYFLESTYGLLLLYSTVVVLARMRQRSLTALDLFFFTTPLALVFLSTFFAWINYKQPIIYGLAENRKALSFLFWFVFDGIRRRYELDADDVFRALLWCAAIYLVLSLLIQAVASDRLLTRPNIPDLDPRKLRITSPGDCFAIAFLYGTVSLACKRSIAHAVPMLIGLTGLLLIAQTRSLTLLALLVAGLAVLVLRPAVTVRAAAAGAVAVGLLMVGFDKDPIGSVFDYVLRGGDSVSLDDNIRAQTAQIALRLLAENYYFGLGALSVMFDGGFKRLYGPYFWINDVGLLGEFFRIGFMLLVFMIIYIRLFVGEFVKTKSLVDRTVVICVLAMLLPGGFFFHSGHIHAFAFLVMSAGATAQVRRRFDGGRREPTMSLRAGQGAGGTVRPYRSEMYRQSDAAAST